MSKLNDHDKDTNISQIKAHHDKENTTIVHKTLLQERAEEKKYWTSLHKHKLQQFFFHNILRIILPMARTQQAELSQTKKKPAALASGQGDGELTF